MAKVKKKAAKKIGQPGAYTAIIAEKICEQISTSSKSMKTICGELNIKVATVLCWLSEGHRNYKKDFAKMYARAKEAQADYLAEEILDIADDGSNDLMTITKGDMSYEIENKEVTNRSKLRVDARKWIAAKLKPKKYGDKTDITTNGKELPVSSMVFLSADALTDEQIEKILKKNDMANNEGI